MPFINFSDLVSVKIDYLIVGGGTSGLALAARLSELPNISVLVIEAGSYHNSVPEIDVPGMMGRVIANQKYDWSFMSSPQKHLNNREMLLPRGKGLGGSSLLNFTMNCRPSKTECDMLEKLGNDGWDWESVLFYMKKSENTIFPNGLTDVQAKQYAVGPDITVHGTGGPIYKSMRSLWTGSQAKLFETAEALGVQRNPESGNGVNIGCFSPFSSVDPRSATRSYAVTGYLKPNIQRRNFLVLTDTHVRKIIFEKGDNGVYKAVGVEIVSDGIVKRIDGVRQDVILSSGSLQTPQILEISGIGCPETLKHSNIHNIINLPGVGENLQDHLSVFTIAEIRDSDETFDVLLDPVHLERHKELYNEQRGHLAYGPAPALILLPANQLGTSESIASWKRKAQTKMLESLVNVEPSLKAGLEKQCKVQEGFISDPNEAQAEIMQFVGHPMVPNSVAVPGKQYTALLCLLLHPLSRGSVHITSSDPLVPPEINPNYLANEADLDLLERVVKFAHQLYGTAPLSNIVTSQVLPPVDVMDDTTRLREYIRNHCSTVFHPVGTSSMLPRRAGGVVDSTLKVYGTSNLRVVDLSIMPLELSCHTQSVAYAIGEKAADIIKSELSIN